VAAPRPQYAPRITVRLRDGRTLVQEMTGDEFKWDFATTIQKLESVRDALGLPSGRYDALIDAIATLDRLPDVDHVIELAVAP
ncbi:MAG: hypothetical protein NZ518_09750, partial [Dehalococcoidia bacterium]|nr:hypothetical protein [Dehalococcoidia bacterium]